MFSKACEYGIKATIYVVKQSQDGKRSNLKEISSAIQSPSAFTAKILQKLVHNSIIISTKGKTGGFEVTKKSLNTLTIKKIVTAIDGNGLLNDCALGLKECSNKNPCPLHNKYKVVREDVAFMLNSTKVVDLVKKLKSKTTFLKV